MASSSFGRSLFRRLNKTQDQQSEIAEEIEGIIRVYKNGRVDRLFTWPNACVTEPLSVPVSKGEFVIEKYNLRIRFYVPPCTTKQPLLLYFHGGGFCLGSSAWNRYHYLHAHLCYIANCVILSVDYRLAPENRLPAAYEDGLRAVMWLKEQVLDPSVENSWIGYCNFSSFFIGGENSGANIAYNVVRQLAFNSSLEFNIKPLSLKGIFLIHPFFGGEERKMSELYSHEPNNSERDLKASDVFWRLALPPGLSRDHPWCNPLSGGGATELRRLRIPSAMVISAEMDYLKDRHFEFCAALARACPRVETVLCRGVPHYFQLVERSDVSQERKHEVMARIRAFIHR